MSYQRHHCRRTPVGWFLGSTPKDAAKLSLAPGPVRLNQWNMIPTSAMTPRSRNWCMLKDLWQCCVHEYAGTRHVSQSKLNQCHQSHSKGMARIRSFMFIVRDVLQNQCQSRNRVPWAACKKERLTPHVHELKVAAPQRDLRHTSPILMKLNVTGSRAQITTAYLSIRYAS